MRRILAIILGIAAALAIMALIGRISDAFYPLSIDIDVGDQVAVAGLIDGQPFPAKLLWVSPWLFAAFGGAWLALRVSDWGWAGWIVAALVLAVAVAGILDLPHPRWMQICAVVLPLLGGWLAARLHHKPYPGEPLLG